MEAAERLGVDVVAATERTNTLESHNPSGNSMTLNFLKPERGRPFGQIVFAKISNRRSHTC